MKHSVQELVADLMRASAENRKDDLSVDNSGKTAGQGFTHLRHPAVPCSCDKSTAIPNRVRDRSACCRFVSFKGSFTRGNASRSHGAIEGPANDVNNGVIGMREM